MKTIKDALKIKVLEGDLGQYIADATILSGSPIIGRGKSEYEALYDLLAKFLFMSVGKDFANEGHRRQINKALRDSLDNFN